MPERLKEFWPLVLAGVINTALGLESLETPGLEHRPNEWRLFIDSSVLSLKAVLLHNGNKLPSLPLAYSSHMKENYENVQKLHYYIEYEKWESDLCGDFKMIGFLLGLQGGYTKYSCFLCL